VDINITHFIRSSTLEYLNNVNLSTVVFLIPIEKRGAFGSYYAKWFLIVANTGMSDRIWYSFERSSLGEIDASLEKIDI
jgi:hypothetical protein